MDRQSTRPLETVEFTYDWYRALLDRLRASGRTFRTFSEEGSPGDVLLRHDVDLSIEKAVTTARIEAERDVSSTYCVLVTSPLYNPLERDRREKLRAIKALGHEVALHFSTHEYWTDGARPDADELTERVAAELDILGTALPERPGTVSFHVPPSWVLDRDFESFRNTYSPACFSEMAYVADSGQRWRESPPELPDPESSVQILTHPGLWGESDRDFESRVEWAVSRACRHADRKAELEFLREVYD